jgi:hypothetical protein
MVRVASPDGEGGEPRAMYTKRWSLDGEVAVRLNAQVMPMG